MLAKVMGIWTCARLQWACPAAMLQAADLNCHDKVAGAGSPCSLFVCKNGAGRPDFSRQFYIWLPREGHGPQAVILASSTGLVPMALHCVQGKQLHIVIVKRGLLDCDAVLGTCLVDMGRRDAVTWSAKMKWEC